MQKIIFSILFLIQSISFGQIFKLDIKIDKSNYVLYEPIFAVVTLSNQSDETIKIPGFSVQVKNPYIKIIITDSQGNELKHKDFEACKDYNLLPYSIPPKESICDFLPITGLYGNHISEIDGGAYSLDSYYLPTGSYNLLITFSDEQQKYFVESNKIAFTIEEITKPEDVKVVNELSDNSRVLLRGQNIQFVKNLEDIIKANQKSDLNIITYGKIILSDYLGDRNYYHQYLNEMIDKYPDKIYTFVISSFFWISDKEIFHSSLVRDRFLNSNYYQPLQFFLNELELLNK